eukprot:TRINITY_DN20928_c0_g1_i3.p2 TRINITY_DN20928_c0_g1~~TRINITY_DN20928_c0_g1_i3.p2  ORF type:complete len:126 (+),score=28.98 TRINITY_DN20928_c0_g1_i3:23-379(+)
MNSQVLTPEELEKCKEAFDAFDKDTSGGIDPEELRTVLKFMGQEPSEEEIYRMISEVDEGNTGTITWESFRAMIEKQKLEKGGDDESDTRIFQDRLQLMHMLQWEETLTGLVVLKPND